MKQHFSTLLFTTIFIIFTSIPALSWPVPDTGQAICYNNNLEIPCPEPGEDFYGQDGNYNINPPSYTKLDENGNNLPENVSDWVMVRDNVTGLIWEVKQNNDGVPDYTNLHDADNTYTWYDSRLSGSAAGSPGDGTDTEDFINALNTKQFGGYSDWHLPTIEELHSIVRYMNYPLSFHDAYFRDMQSSAYWSSTTYLAYTYSSSVWLTHFDNGTDSHCNRKSDRNYVLAVCNEHSELFHHLIDNGDATVTDTSSGLMWKQSAEENTMHWQNALMHCEDMLFAGYGDWRLPNISELKSIVDYNSINPSINIKYFPDTQSVRFRSSTTNDFSYHRDYSWNIPFSSGNNENYYHSKSFDLYFRAIRGGQNQIPGHLIISSPLQASLWNANSIMPITWDTAGISGNVKISVSYFGGKNGTFETIAASTPNDGNYDWTIPEVASFNCMLKIEPLSDTAKGTVQGLFTINNFFKINPADIVLTEPVNENETGKSKIFTITMNVQPSSDVILNLASSNPGEFSVSPETITLNASNWNTGATVTVTPEWDGIIDGDQRSFVLASTKSGLINVEELALLYVTVRDSDSGIAVTSVYPTYETANQDLPVTIKGTGFSDGVQVFIYPEGGTETQITPVTVHDNNTLSLIIPGQNAGDYNLKVGDYEVIGAVSFANTAAIEAQKRKKAIIVAGSGPYFGNTLWDATKNSTKKAYLALYSQGYDSDSIYYLSREGFADVTGNRENDIDADATLFNFQNAVKTWVDNPSDPTSALLIYMMGHGGNGTFLFGSPQNPKNLTPNVLNTWLDDLQTSMTGQIIIIYDACQSGSFLSPLSGTNRLIITGAQTNERAWFLDDGEISFSWFFWNSIFANGKINAAFNEAAAKLTLMQTPQMDDHSGLPRKGMRRTNGDDITVGRGRVMSLSPPEITSLSFDPPYLEGDNTTADIIAGNVHDTNASGMSRVWARILSPFDAFKSLDDPVLVVPTIPLDGPDDGDNYQIAFDAFTQTGDYKIFVHAIDKMGLTANAKQATYQQRGGEGLSPGDFNADSYVDLKDALIALQVACGYPIPSSADLEVTGDDQVGIADALWIIQKVAGVLGE